MSHEVVLIGSGVSGLSCAVRLLDAGFAVRVLARELASSTTSSVAGAVWYPYRAYPVDRVLGWAGATYRAFAELAASDPECGVRMIQLVEVFRERADDPWWRGAVDGFERCVPVELPAGYVDGYRAVVPAIDTPVYLEYLVARVERLGGTIEQRSVDTIGELGAPLVVNCAGLGSRELVKDREMFPIRGQLLAVENPGVSDCLVDELGADGPRYVIPHTDRCVLGGTADEGEWALEVDPDRSASIHAECARLAPALAGARVVREAVGLRPGRSAVRLERETTTSGEVVHDYGHGGAGFTLSWGCADEVVTLVRDAITSARG